MGAQIKTLMASERGLDSSYLPEYLRGDFRIKLIDQPGKEGTYIAGIDLPINNINVIWAGGVGKTMREHLGMFNPLFKTPIEIALNMDTYTGQSLKGRRWMGWSGPVMDEGFPQWAKDLIDLRKIEKANGEIVYTANGMNTYLLTKNLLVGRIINEGLRVQKMAIEFGNGDARQGAFELMRVFSGLRLNEFDLTEGQRNEMTNKLRAIEEMLVEQGSMATFEKAFRPKSQRKRSWGR